MSEICQNCKHWYPRVGAGNVGTCRRFPAKVTTHPHEMCGEWEAKVVKAGDVVTHRECPALPEGNEGIAMPTGVAEPVKPIVSRTYRGDPVDPLSAVSAALERAEALPGATKDADRIDKAKKGGRR